MFQYSVTVLHSYTMLRAFQKSNEDGGYLGSFPLDVNQPSIKKKGAVSVSNIKLFTTQGKRLVDQLQILKKKKSYFYYEQPQEK